MKTAITVDYDDWSGLKELTRFTWECEIDGIRFECLATKPGDHARLADGGFSSRQFADDIRSEACKRGYPVEFFIYRGWQCIVKHTKQEDVKP